MHARKFLMCFVALSERKPTPIDTIDIHDRHSYRLSQYIQSIDLAIGPHESDPPRNPLLHQFHHPLLLPQHVLHSHITRNGH